MIDWSEVWLKIDSNMRQFQDLILKNQKEAAAKVMEEITKASEQLSQWVKGSK
jgi:hypothetical protein